MKKRNRATLRVFLAGLYPALCLFLAGSCSPGSSSPASPHEGQWLQKTDKTDRSDPWFTVTRLPVHLPEGSDAAVDLSRNFYIIFDGSGSMAERVDSRCGANERFNRKIDGARWALGEFIATVADEVNLGLFVFDRHGAREVLPLSRLNRDAFRQAVAEISVGGTTPLASAIRFASDRLNEQYIKQLGYGEYRLLVITDGLAEAIPKSALYAAERGVPIYTIGLCIDSDHPLRQYSVSYQAVDNFTDLKKHLDATLAELPDFAPGDFPQEEQQRP